MIYCKRCLYPSNHPYGMIFDDDGVCMGCRVHEEKDILDWDERFKKLKKIAHTNSKIMGNKSFDCIVPVTGGGDSYFIVHVVKNILGMNPLLVNYNSHYNTKIGIRNLANLSTVFDCDIVTSTLSPNHLKRITKQTLTQFGSMYWQVLAGYTTFPVQTAVRFRIPLIIWGVHPWSEQTGMFSHLDEVEMSHRCRKEHALMGITAEDLVNEKSNITRSEVQPFIYPYDNELEKVGVRGIYLSNYIRWDSKSQHEFMINEYGYETSKMQRTFNNYEDVHCFHSAGIHDYIKYLKYGYSKVTDHASREIRLKRMTRETGIKMVEKYTSKEPDDLNLFLEWLNIGKDEFFNYIDRFRDKKIWKFNNNKWILKDSIMNHVESNDVFLKDIKDNCHFQITKSAEPSIADNKYLLMGRGYIDSRDYGAHEDQSKGGGMTKRKWKRPSIK
jgi:N-acetyl sugar amidotransferase